MFIDEGIQCKDSPIRNYKTVLVRSYLRSSLGLPTIKSITEQDKRPRSSDFRLGVVILSAKMKNNISEAWNIAKI